MSNIVGDVYKNTVTVTVETMIHNPVASHFGAEDESCIEKREYNICELFENSELRNKFLEFSTRRPGDCMDCSVKFGKLWFTLASLK